MYRMNSYQVPREYSMRRLAAIALLLIASPFGVAGPSNSLMDVTPNGKALVVDNNDSGTVTLIDLEKQEKVREIKVGKKPEGVTWIGDGPLAAITLYHEMAVVVVDTNSGKIEK